MEIYLKELFQEYGPLSLGWIVAAVLGWRVFSESKDNKLSTKEVMAEYNDLIDSYHAAIVENTRVTERLAMLIEERTRRQGNNGK